MVLPSLGILIVMGKKLTAPASAAPSG